MRAINPAHLNFGKSQRQYADRKAVYKTAAQFYFYAFWFAPIFQFHILDVKLEVRPGFSETGYTICKMDI